MRGSLPKLTTTTGIALVLVAGSGLSPHVSRSEAEDYPTYPDTEYNGTKTCSAVTGECQSCEPEGGTTFVHGADPTAPEAGYHQGNCMNQQGGGNGCRGTYYKCVKRTCSDRKAVTPVEYLYTGNWCK